MSTEDGNKHVEIEARWINQNRENIERKLTAVGARRVFESLFREWIFAYPKWAKDNRRIRVRTDGTTAWLTYKANLTWGIDSTEEVEVTVSSAEDAVKLLEKTDIPLQRYQEKKRIEYKLNETDVDLDFWPRIPMVIEIEGLSEEAVRGSANKLGLAWEEAVFEDQYVLHKKYFGVDLSKVPNYIFDK